VGVEEGAGVEDLDGSVGVFDYVVVDVAASSRGNQPNPDLLGVVIVLFVLQGKDSRSCDWGSLVVLAFLVRWGNLCTLLLETFIRLFVRLACGVGVAFRLKGFSLLLFLLLRFLVDPVLL
jgi:hypothetical protein